ncbi:hypothetical protein AVEN_107378-1 [Araneus ventricosus]|uniref:DDE-1 domain-containing protein n=1 Tax=Araneus ventricosus TaxID=182803 RepID=A0A4Y2PQ21_ARAVE|nr:hypothetical protein AVEN_107378-1 [Araneus ventricosus]
MIWKSKTPICFKGKDIRKLGIHWKSNRKAWMTDAIFEEWLTDIDQKMAKEGRNVLLVLDNVYKLWNGELQICISIQELIQRLKRKVHLITSFNRSNLR